MLFYRRALRVFVVCTLFVSPAATLAQSNSAIDYNTARLALTLPAVRAAGVSTVDGVLDEATWAAASLATNFVENDQREGQTATLDTEVKLLYDDDALYIGVFAKDDEPAGIIINELHKDFNI